jgi:DNA-binding GntR family transcriptional regulator
LEKGKQIQGPFVVAALAPRCGRDINDANRRVVEIPVYRHMPCYGCFVEAEQLGRPQTLTDLVHGWIRRAIMTGALSPGQRVTEAEVARQLGVSKTPVRESMLRLRELGLLEDDGRRGHRVVMSTATAIDEAYQLRELLEPFAARRAAEIAGEDVRTGIARAAERTLQAAVEEAGEGDQHLADQAFHESIAAACENRRIAKAIGDASALVRVVAPGVPDRRFFYDRLRVAGDEHVQIAKAIVRGDGDAAAAQMERHLRRIRLALRDLSAQAAVAGPHRERLAGERS